jgi:polyisoprenoid-binding protein YceI
MSDGTKDVTPAASAAPTGSAESADLATLVGGGAGAGQWALDPAGSRFEFAVKNFWGAITVRGTFDAVSGSAQVGADGSITGRLEMDATTVNTKNKQRDKHLRSADFFDVEQHPHLVLTIESGEPTDHARLACKGTLEAAGHVKPLEFTAQVDQANASAAVLTAEFDLDRSEFGMTWRPLGMSAMIAHGKATARFVRA